MLASLTRIDGNYCFKHIATLMAIGWILVFYWKHNVFFHFIRCLLFRLTGSRKSIGATKRTVGLVGVASVGIQVDGIAQERSIDTIFRKRKIRNI